MYTTKPAAHTKKSAALYHTQQGAKTQNSVWYTWYNMGQIISF